MRQQLTTHPIRTLGAVLALAFVLFMVSGIPALRYAHSGTVAFVVGDIAWFGFLLSGLTFLVGAVYVGVHAALGRREA